MFIDYGLTTRLCLIEFYTNLLGESYSNKMILCVHTQLPFFLISQMPLQHPTSAILYMSAMMVTMVTGFSVKPAGVALVVVDVQGCFLDPRRPLHAVGAGGVVPGVNTLRARYDHVLTCVVYVQDVHCPDHVAFASQHPGREAFETVTLNYSDNGERTMMLLAYTLYVLPDEAL